MKHRTLYSVGALFIVAAVIFGIESTKPMRTTSDGAPITVLPSGERQLMKAKEFPLAIDISSPNAFLNSDPFTIEEHVGSKVILVDFWTYSCINCQRTLPYLNDWHEKYADDGLLIIGIHTPEFEFEKDIENVRRAVEKYEIAYPVVLDNDYSTWSAYKNRYWPRKYLIDIDGFIVYDHIGEGAYAETEEKIVSLLNERKAVLGEKNIVRVEETDPLGETVSFDQVHTPETYLGRNRIEYLVNLPETSCLSGSCSYTYSPSAPFSGFELMGNWRIDEEYMTLEKTPGSIRISFDANKVNLVAGGGKRVRAEVFLDGKRITDASTGAAVTDGIVTFSEYDLYNLVDLRGEYGAHVLEIRFLDPGISAFAFTFG